jgi:serine/threonine-protein phosphatase 6 regulatory ankyrin repeat subunit B
MDESTGRSEVVDLATTAMIIRIISVGAAVFLLSPFAIDVSAGQESLPQAAYKNDRDQVETLLREGADPNKPFADATALLLTAEKGYPDLTRLLLQNGANPNLADQSGQTPLMWAARNDHIDVVRLLLRAGADVNSEDTRGETAITWAVKSGDPNVVKRLVDSGAKVSPEDGVSLRDAAKTGNEELVGVLLAAGANPCAKEWNNQNAIEAAADKGFLNVLKSVLEKSSQCADRNHELQEALSVATRSGHVPVVRYLLDQAPVDAETIRWVLDESNKEVVELVLDKVSPPDVSESDAKAIILALLRLKDTQRLDRFLKAGGKIDGAFDYDGITPLIDRCFEGDTESVRLLLDRGASIRKATKHGETPLLATAGGGHMEIAELLLRRGAQLNEKDDHGRDALLNAANLGHVEMCAFLIKHGAKINSADNEGLTALHYAADRGDVALTKMLLELKANPFARDRGGKTPLDHAQERGSAEVVDLLKDSVGQPKTTNRKPPR